MSENTQPNAENTADGRSDSNGGLGFALHDLPPEGSALRKLGKRLAELLDEDQWAECEQMLFEISGEIKALKYSLQLDEELIGMIQKIITVLNNRPVPNMCIGRKLNIG